MGIILDTSLLIANERGTLDLNGFLQQSSNLSPAIAAITASDLLHGVERAVDPDRKERRKKHVEQLLSAVALVAFDLHRHAAMLASGQTCNNAAR